MLGVAVSSLQTCKSRYQDMKQNILGEKINLKYQFKIFLQSRQCFPLKTQYKPLFFSHICFSPQASRSQTPCFLNPDFQLIRIHVLDKQWNLCRMHTAILIVIFYRQVNMV